MKRNQLKIWAFVFGIALTLSSCSDWLDYTPKDKQTAQQQFSTREGFYNAVNGIYNTVSSNTLYGYNLSYGPLDIMGQCYKMSSSNTTAYAYQKYAWTNSSVSSNFSSIWSSMYNTILNINLVLDEVDKQGTTLSDVDAKVIKGEMLALRAFLHFDLLRLFGPVYKNKPHDLSVPFNDGIVAMRRDRLPADEMIDNKLIPDLTTAQELLKGSDPVITSGPLNSDGGDDGNLLRYRQLRMNYYAVCLLKARVYLWKQDYTNALAEAKKITDDANVAKWFPFVESSKLLANSINPDRLFSTECLFGFYVKPMSDIYLNSFSGSLDVATIMQPRKGYLNILFSSTGDYRRQSQWTGSSSSSGSEYDFIKYKGFTANTTTPEFWATYFGLMRISEAYYIAAESSLNLNDNKTDAARYLNVILSAHGAKTVDATASKADILQEIKMEYLREMRGEGQIFFMFKRFYQDFSSVFSWETWETEPGNSIFNAAQEPSEDDIYNLSNSRYVIPVPTSETN